MWQPIVDGFVWTDDRLGIGKLLSLDTVDGEVEFNHSAVRTEKRTYRLTDLKRAYLPLQTRVYHSRAERWFLGRVLERFVRGDQPASYLIRFPGYQPLELPEAELRVRCLLPLADPTEVLAAGAVEGQFLADRRTGVLEQLAYARRVSRSLGGLLSASVDLLPHQVEVVRRVTEDPIQRYLLADEVGLGKTVEAAAIMAQAILDHPQDRVVVLTPRSLARQWGQELLQRFGLGPDEVRVVPFEGIGEVDVGDVDFLVVDEVHHLITAPDASSRDIETYKQLAHISRSVPRLLLLSATPVLGDSKSTLALLHLLDSDRYRLEEQSAFEHLLENRQEFGRVLLSLNADSAPLILRRAVERLNKLAPEDAVAGELCRNLSGAVENHDTQRVPSAVRALRDHITETYRLNRRLLRTRRRDTEGWELPVRESRVTVEIDEDDRMAAAWDALEEWRYRAVASISRDDETEKETGHEPGAVRETDRFLLRRFIELFDALGRGVQAFADQIADQSVRADSQFATFPEEAEIVERVAAMRDASNDGSDRGELGAAIIDLTLRGTVKRDAFVAPKVVAFTSSSSFARDVASHLTRLRGFGVSHLITADLDEHEIERAAGRFRDSTVPVALICDGSGEEGLNLQFADAVVHLDLPFDPLRLEQRIGRLDRIGRSAGTIRHRVLIPTDDEESPWLAWLDVLRSGLNVFDETIADIQFALGRILQEAREVLFRQGARGLQEFIARSQQLLLEERTKLDEQYALDRLEMGEADAHILFDQLTDAEKADRELASSMSSWWHEVLRLERSTDDEARTGVFRLSWTDATLAPREPWEASIEAALDKPLTFDRSIALRSLGTRLVRSGNPLVEALPRFLRYDDRGTAFMTWRMEPAWTTDEVGPWIGFKLVYVVELDAEEIAARVWSSPDPVGTAALQRRADLLFPPWVETHFVDAALAPVEDPRLRAILARPYDKRPKNSGGRDFNLAGRTGALDPLVDPKTLVAWCEAVRDAAPLLVRAEARFEHHLAEARDRAQRDLGVRTERLERRRLAQVREGGLNESTLDTEIAMANQILQEVDSPTVRLDSVGILVVSDERPSSESVS